MTLKKLKGLIPEKILTIFQVPGVFLEIISKEINRTYILFKFRNKLIPNKSAS